MVRNKLQPRTGQRALHDRGGGHPGSTHLLKLSPCCKALRGWSHLLLATVGAMKGHMPPSSPHCGLSETPGDANAQPHGSTGPQSDLSICANVNTKLPPTPLQQSIPGALWEGEDGHDRP